MVRQQSTLQNDQLFAEVEPPPPRAMTPPDMPTADLTQAVMKYIRA
jgi:hypothetical protein